MVVPPGVPRVADGTVYVGKPGRLAALDAESGAPLWGHPLPETPASAAVGTDAIHVAAGERVRAIAADDGTERWTASFDADAEIRGLAPRPRPRDGRPFRRVATRPWVQRAGRRREPPGELRVFAAE